MQQLSCASVLVPLHHHSAVLQSNEHAAAQAAVSSTARYASQACEVLYVVFSNQQSVPPDFLVQHQKSSECLLLDWLPPDEV